MFSNSLKYLTKKFNKQTLSEVKPAPPSETVDHTILSTKLDTSSLTSLPSPLPSLLIDSTDHVSTIKQHPPSDDDPLPDNRQSHLLTDHTFTDKPIGDFTSNPSSTFVSNKDSSLSTFTNNPSSTYIDNPSVFKNLAPSSPSITISSSSLSPASSVSSDSEDDEVEQSASSLGNSSSHFTTPLKIERISSAEKRKYSQFKCSTGNSSPSSSDDEIKEAFEMNSYRQHNHHYLNHHHSPSTSHTWAWGQSSTAFISSEQPVPGWNIDHFEPSSRPLKVVPMGCHKHKFFAKMSTNYSERPFLDFNKMQHSKRSVMVRRPMVIRNNSKVHSIQRPSPTSLQVTLDISQHSFQPVLTPT